MRFRCLSIAVFTSARPIAIIWVHIRGEGYMQIRHRPAIHPLLWRAFRSVKPRLPRHSFWTQTTAGGYLAYSFHHLYFLIPATKLIMHQNVYAVRIGHFYKRDPSGRYGNLLPTRRFHLHYITFWYFARCYDQHPNSIGGISNLSGNVNRLHRPAPSQAQQLGGGNHRPADR